MRRIQVLGFVRTPAFVARFSGQTLFTLEGVTKMFHVKDREPRVLFENVNMCIPEGSKIGLIGVNGTGKSTLMKILANRDTDFEGKAFASKGAVVEYLEQEPKLDPSKTVYENVVAAVEDKVRLITRMEEIGEEFSKPDADFEKLIEEQSSVMEAIDEFKVWDIVRKAETSMTCLNCPPPDSSVEFLSGGEKRRVALARLLVSGANLLVLDEPTNHLDAQSVSWLEMYLKHYKGAVVAVTHDRYFLDNVADMIIELDNGQLYLHKGNYSSWLEAKTKRMELQKKKNQGLFRRMKKEMKAIQEAKENISKSVSKTRQANYDELVEAHQKASIKDTIASGKLLIPSGPRLGDKVIDVDRVSMEFDGRQLFSNLSFKVGPGDILGIVGRNGCGKTTLFRILTGELQPQQGSVSVGRAVSMGFADQSRGFTSEEHTLVEEISQGARSLNIGEQEFNVRTYIAQFNFRKEAQEKLMRHLSGGERNRVHLAKLLKNGHNVLMFDEPTNDLDIETLRSLEEGLREFPGSAVIISHDRWFLDRICTKVLVFQEDGKVVMHPGSYASYLQQHGSSQEFIKNQESSAKAATFI